MKPRVFVVDDAPFVRDVLRVVVEQGGFEWVGEAADGVEAVEGVLRVRPDVVLMDIVMPLKSGIDAAKEILAKHPEIRIIACSTVELESMMMKALESGFADYVVKPFQAKDVIERIAKSFLKLKSA